MRATAWAISGTGQADSATTTMLTEKQRKSGDDADLRRVGSYPGRSRAGVHLAQLHTP
jgi:hypothetical protein